MLIVSLLSLAQGVLACAHAPIFLSVSREGWGYGWWGRKEQNGRRGGKREAELRGGDVMSADEPGGCIMVLVAL